MIMENLISIGSIDFSAMNEYMSLLDERIGAMALQTKAVMTMILNDLLLFIKG